LGLSTNPEDAMAKDTVRYSSAFKSKIVSEIERGKHSILSARRMYDIAGKGTVANWIRQLGKNHLIGKVVRVETLDERSKLKQLHDDKQRLESALANEHLRVLALENMLELASRDLGVDLKKKYGTKA
jgi:transposase-like protein